jgi:hypothetical protein
LLLLLPLLLLLLLQLLLLLPLLLPPVVASSRTHCSITGTLLCFHRCGSDAASRSSMPLIVTALL